MCKRDEESFAPALPFHERIEGYGFWFIWSSWLMPEEVLGLLKQHNIYGRLFDLFPTAWCGMFDAKGILELLKRVSSLF